MTIFADLGWVGGSEKVKKNADVIKGWSLIKEGNQSRFRIASSSNFATIFNFEAAIIYWRNLLFDGLITYLD